MHIHPKPGRRHGCVCHAHPLATGLRWPNPAEENGTAEAVLVLGTILVEYGTPGTDELYQSPSKYILITMPFCRPITAL
jgi:hypothetical protein